MSHITARDAGTKSSENPTWFYRFFVGYTIYTLVLLALLYADFFRDLAAPDPIWNSTLYRLFLGFVLVPGGLIIAVLILRRTHRNVTGLFLVMHAAAIMQSSLRVGSELHVLNAWFNNAYLGLWLLPLYFPDGDTHPVRFRGALRVYSVITAILFALVTLFTETTEIQMGGGEFILGPNPLLVNAPPWIAQPVLLLQAFTWITTVLWIIPSIIIRYRASDTRARQQIKWFVWGFAIFIVIFIIAIATGTATGATQTSRFGIFGIVYVVYAMFVFPAAPFLLVGYAVLRHKLYDIDVIIRRTLVYSVITGILAGVYFGGVTLLQSLFSSVTRSNSTLAVVISTLAIAALFTPVRRRVQRFVDRRFYRQQYDTQKTLDAFAAAMRDDVDLERIRADLIEVVETTLQPESVSLWLTTSRAQSKEHRVP